MTPCANMLRRQAFSGTAIWLRGAWHRFLSSKRAMHRSVLLHMRLISDLRLYKIEQCRNLRKLGRSGKTWAVFNFIQTHPRHARRLLMVRAAIARPPDRVSALCLSQTCVEKRGI